MKDILNVPSYSNLRSHAKCKLMHLGLRSKTEQVNLYDEEEWAKPDIRDEVIKKIEHFLIKYIR